MVEKMICPHFGQCGGCRLYDLSYEEQLEHKTQRVKEQLKNIEADILPIIPCSLPYRFRNKVEFTFFCTPENKVGVGFHKKGSYNDLVDLQECLITPANNLEILKYIRDWANEQQLTAYQKKKRVGLLRYLLIRDSFKEKNKIIIIVANGGSKELFLPLANQLAEKFPLAGLAWSNQPETADAVLLENWEIVYGRDYLIDDIGSLTYKIPLNSFFQVNTVASNLLYELIAAQVQPNDNVLDLFCGAGTISCYIGKKANYVFGLEIVESAIISARENATLNQIDNLEFMSGRVRERLANLRFDKHFHTVILDPPRSGTDKKTMGRIADLEPERIVYVACGFENLAYNLGTLLENNYVIDSIQPLDMFPQTPHVEVVITLIKNVKGETSHSGCVIMSSRT